MNKLFEIETDEIELSWRAPTGQGRKLIDGIGDVSGHLQIYRHRKGLEFSRVWRAAVPETVAFDPDLTIGPQLYEQTDYSVFVRSKSGKRLSLVHSDPNLLKSLIVEENGTRLFGSINFGSEVGFSRFTVNADSQPEFDFAIEVFPTKLDYKSDYEQLVAETQDYISGLVFEYIKSTYKLSLPVLEKQSSSVEWLLLLNLVVQELEQAANFVAHHPVRGLIREPQTVSAEKVKRLDSYVRRAIQRGAGSGAVLLVDDLQVRQHLPNRRTSFTLDTPENRWISTQLMRIRERLVALRLRELEREETARRQKTIEDLRSLEQRIFKIQQFEPFQASEEMPPPGFASMQLLSAPGYRDCYRACNMLSLGLQVEGGPVNLSLKEISTLYEYWCYLTLIHHLSIQTGRRVPVEQLVKASHSGLEILLKKGKESTLSFEDESGRRITVVYNKKIAGDSVLVPQNPDLMITLEESAWPALNMLLDSKYRVRFEEDYVNTYNAPGPDIDAVNALHRYRDAILESNTTATDDRPKRTIIQAAALFPYRESIDGSYRQSKLWKSLDKLGIGAIPLLPGDKRYFKEWVSNILVHGGWSIADQAIGHQATQKAQDWRIAASEPVLIGVLRSENAAEHLQWIVENNCYYTRLRKTHPRQLAVKWVAIYSPLVLRKPGAITHKARVLSVDVQPRKEISTPWAASRDSETLQVIYHLAEVEPVAHPIENRGDDGKGQRFSVERWASRLSLERAKVITELFLETEPEWRLYEELRAAQIHFTLVPMSPGTLSQDDPGWRTWFVLTDGTRIRYAGIHGFFLETVAGSEEIIPAADDVAKLIMGLSDERKQ